MQVVKRFLSEDEPWYVFLSSPLRRYEEDRPCPQAPMVTMESAKLMPRDGVTQRSTLAFNSSETYLTSCKLMWEVSLKS